MYQKLCKDLEIVKNKVNTDDITPDLIQLLVLRKSERAGQKDQSYARRWFCARTEYKALCWIPQNRVLVGHPLCCITCLVKTQGCLYYCSLRSSQKEHWLSLPVNSSAGASLLREFSSFLLDDQAAGRSCRAVSSPYPGIQPYLMCSDPHPPTLPCGCPEAPDPLGIALPNLALSLHRCCQRP